MSEKGKGIQIDFNKLVTTGVTFDIDPSQINENNEEYSDNEVTEEEYYKEVTNHANLACLGSFEDEDVYDTAEPFSVLEAKMINLYDNGAIKKRVLREGYGNLPEEKSLIRVHYNAYTEFVEEPFDCTYARKRPHQFVLGNGEVVPGLDIAVQSMKLNEKSQFLIKPKYAYGAIGCLERIPPNSTILFEIELLEIVECGAAEKYENLPEEEKNFEVTYKMCIAKSAKAKDLFQRQKYTAAVREYNYAASSLEFAILANEEEQVKQQEQLFKLYSNLLVCLTLMREPRKACINFNKLNNLTKGSGLKLTAKSFFHHAKCLRMLGDYSRAKSELQKAHQLEPRNPDILEEFAILDEEDAKYRNKERNMAKAMFK